MLGTGFFGPPAASGLRGLTTGFSGGPWAPGEPGAGQWLDRAVSRGAGVARLNIAWMDVAPELRPRGFNPSDPASPGYNWSGTDSQIRGVTAHGLRVLFMVYSAPKWAQGAGRPADAGGTWRPNAAQLADFARAAATRYSGHYPDPLHPGKFLPRVSHWEAWNEPNLGANISPQWQHTQAGWVPASPSIYRPMLNAFYSAIKGVDPSNFVVSAGTAPYGDAGPGNRGLRRWRVRPLTFYRELFCLTASLHKHCPGSVHFDAIDHHPYVFGPPTQLPYWPTDIDIADMWKLARVLHSGERAGTVKPGGAQIWTTEVTWDSTPPSHTIDSVPIARQARYAEEALYLLWRQGVSTVLWLDIADFTPVVNSDALAYGGLYYASGAPKPSAIAFRFPFVSHRIDSTHVQAWGRAPAAGTLLIEREIGIERWSVLARFHVGPHQVFQDTLRVSGPATLRAKLGPSTSLTWSQSG